MGALIYRESQLEWQAQKGATKGCKPPHEKLLTAKDRLLSTRSINHCLHSPQCMLVRKGNGSLRWKIKSAEEKGGQKKEVKRICW